MKSESLFEKRKKVKQRKPDFIVKEAKFSSGVKKRWRFPRGKHSATRQREKGRPSLPNPGYGSPKEVKGLHPSGKEPVVICSLTDLVKLNKKNQGAILSSRLGLRKKLELLKSAQEQDIEIFNIKDVKTSIDSINKIIEDRKKAKSEKLKVRNKKEEAKKKKAEEKKKKEEEKSKKDDESVEDKINEEKSQKKEIEKTIIKRQ